ncbi:MAG: hypothetical protein ACT4OY_02860 [Alphaproteobacteria bacterium]
MILLTIVYNKFADQRYQPQAEIPVPAAKVSASTDAKASFNVMAPGLATSYTLSSRLGSLNEKFSQKMELMDLTYGPRGQKVHYNFNSNDINNGIDCSGYAGMHIQLYFENFALDSEARKRIDNIKPLTSHDQIRELQSMGATIHKGQFTTNSFAFREGMVIGLDKGNKGWDKGRKKEGAIDANLDHIASVYKAPDGSLRVSESSGQGGVKSTELNQWLQNNRSATLYVADLAEIAAKQQPGITIATAKPSNSVSPT